MTTKALFAQSFLGRPERAAAGVPLPAGRYCCIIPQEDLVISAIEIPGGIGAGDEFVTATNYATKTLAKGIPFYCQFNTVTLTGAAECYRVTHHAGSNVWPIL